jgi:hypothetical protein
MKVRIEPFGPQALPDPKLACDRECRERNVCKCGSSQDKHCCQHSVVRTSKVIRGRLW